MPDNTDFMDKTITRLGAIFSKMVKNYSTPGDGWKNIGLGHDAFRLMQSLPDVFPGEYETPAEKAGLLSQMLDQMVETESPRFCITVRREIERLNPGDEENIRESGMLLDYIDTSIPMEEFCRRYKRHLKFDPVERTEEYERVIPDVERAIAGQLKGHPRRMGFCFLYWSAKKTELAKRGIEWNSPAYMNPCVMFD